MKECPSSEIACAQAEDQFRVDCYGCGFANVEWLAQFRKRLYQEGVRP